MDAGIINIIALRERLGWTQQQLAEHCGVDRSTVSKWEAEPPTKGPALILLRQLDGGRSGHCARLDTIASVAAREGAT